MAQKLKGPSHTELRCCGQGISISAWQFHPQRKADRHVAGRSRHMLPMTDQCRSLRPQVAPAGCFVALVGMHFQTKIAQANFFKATIDDIECSRFFRQARRKIILAMVWLLPVPGGPMSTKSLTLAALNVAAYCKESANRGQ